MKTLLVALNAQYMHLSLALRQLQAAAPEVNTLQAHINLPFRALFEDIARVGADAIGFSTYIWNANVVDRLCRTLREAFPEILLFAGGPEVALTPRETLQKKPFLDFVLSGEGERSLPALLRALETGDFENAPGVSYRRGEKIFVNPAPAPLAPEDWPDVYSSGVQGLERRILYIETARGCPFRCRYCLSSETGAVRALSAEEALRRLTALADAGATLIKLVDRTFNFDEKRAVAIWRGLIAHSRKRGVYPTYHFEIAAHLLTDRSFDVLKDAPKGLFQFEAGIQTTEPTALRAIGRDVPFEALREKLLRVAGFQTIHLHVDLIAGLPGEGPKAFQKSFDDAFSLGAERLQLGFLKLLPGCALWREAEALGLRYEPDPPYEILSTPEMSLFDLMRLKDIERVLDWYQNSGRYPLTLRYLLAGRSPFAFFSALAADYRASGVFEIERGEKARAQLLLERFDAPKPRALLTHDFLHGGRRRELPPALAFQEDDMLRSLLRERFSPVRGQSACRYDFDVLAFERGEALEKIETIVLYPAT